MSRQVGLSRNPTFPRSEWLFFYLGGVFIMTIEPLDDLQKLDLISRRVPLSGPYCLTALKRRAMEESCLEVCSFRYCEP